MIDEQLEEIMDGSKKNRIWQHINSEFPPPTFYYKLSEDVTLKEKEDCFVISINKEPGRICDSRVDITIEKKLEIKQELIRALEMIGMDLLKIAKKLGEKR